jgi:hypothetical protein
VRNQGYEGGELPGVEYAPDLPPAPAVTIEDVYAAMKIPEVTALPAADAAHEGDMVRLKPTGGDPTQTMVCCKTSAGGYEWVGFGQSS